MQEKSKYNLSLKYIIIIIIIIILISSPGSRAQHCNYDTLLAGRCVLNTTSKC